MDRNQVKNKIESRYYYLYNNIISILAPYVHEYTDSEVEELEKKYNIKLANKPIELTKFHKYVLYMLEEYLLGDYKYTHESGFYTFTESKKNDPEYKQLVDNAMVLVATANSRYDNEALKIKLDMWQVLDQVYEYVYSQRNNIHTKKKKLAILDEYYRLLRYTNDGRKWTSGYLLNSIDIIVNLDGHNPEYDRGTFSSVKGSKTDKHVMPNDFINSAVDFQFTEKEKQRIYLMFHDELPWDLEITCEEHEDDPLYRESNFEPCSEYFYADADKMIWHDGHIYQECPHCGYLVDVNDYPLSPGIIKQIRERSTPKKFKAIYFDSEMYALGKHREEEKRRTRKKGKYGRNV